MGFHEFNPNRKLEEKSRRDRSLISSSATALGIGEALENNEDTDLDGTKNTIKVKMQLMTSGLIKI